jgi:hypothetical protein
MDILVLLLVRDLVRGLVLIIGFHDGLVYAGYTKTRLRIESRFGI